jgi:large subunit ribosomal protein L27e
MGKFYKPGKVVVVLNGRNAGSKGIIVKSNYDNSKDRKYPHCVVVGLSKGPRKPTKRNIAKLQARIKKLESDKDSADKLAALKSFGVFIKTYNMSHLLATRYTVKEDFGIVKSLEKIENLEKKLKEDKAAIDAKEKSKKDDAKESAKELEELKTKYGNAENEYKNEVRNTKIKIGGEMYKRYMQGFTKGKKEEDLENQQHTQYLFKKLKF